MVKIIGVKFKQKGKVYYFDPDNLNIKLHDFVIVETSRSLEYGEVVIPVSDIEEKNLVSPLKKVIRIATEADARQAEQNRKKEENAFNICNEKIIKHGLDMKLIEVEYTFDGSKILFYFTSGGRVDFRELVKDLASVFRTRIELRQIGVRDEAKLLGGLGICGRNLCCASHLSDFQPVSIKMAKEQSLSLNPTKISGTCGRLMCCLKYEQDCYEELNKITPKPGAIVSTPDGQGTVWSTSVLAGKLKVKLDKDDDNVLRDFTVDDIKILKNPKRSQQSFEDDVDMEELKKLEG